MKRFDAQNAPSRSTVVTAALLLSLFAACSRSQNSSPENFRVIGTYKAEYFSDTGQVTYTPVDRTTGKPLQQNAFALTTYDNSAGAAYCAIRDHSIADPNEPNACMGLIDPDNCSTDYNETTHVLSFYAKLVNKSNLPNDYDSVTNPTGYEYVYPGYYDPNSIFYAPFYFTMWGLDWSPSGSELVTAVNTNLSGGDCSSESGMTLSGNDLDSNYRFDCLYPDLDFDGYKSDYPGWDFTSYVADGTMDPGEDTGCVQFMQFTLTQNSNFTIYFDVLAVADQPGTPSAPTVTTPASASYINSNPITVNVSDCPTGGTLYVDGGDASASIACSAASQNISVTLRSNQENTLSVYYVDSGIQGPATVVTVTHDDTAPTVVSWVPADSEVVVGTVARCIATFSEPMDQATFNAGTGTGGGSCATGNFLMCNGGNRVDGTISFSSDSTQVVYTPNSALSSDTSYTCNIQTASGAPTTVRDLAGNAPTNESITFTTGTSGQDVTAPYVKSIFPADNSTISPNSSFFIYFSEAVEESTLSATDCSSGGGTPIPNIAVWQNNSCVTAGYPTPRPNIINGTISLNADGDIATFTPSTAMEADDCISITIGACVRDLSGNALPSRGSFAIGAYGGETLSYNSWNIFYTSAVADSTGPNLVHVGPVLDAANVRNRVYPFVIFNEPIDISTVVSDYFYMTVFGNPSKIGLSLKADPTLQMITYKTAVNLSTSTNHVITVTGAVADTSGNLMPAPQTSNFTTDSTADSTAPTVLSVTPSDGSSASRCTDIDIHFSEAMNEATLNGSNIQLVQGGTLDVIPIDIKASDNGTHVRLLPQSSLYTGLGVTTFTGKLSRNSDTITNVSSQDGLVVGMVLYHQRIPNGTTITALPTSTTITMSSDATRNVNNATITSDGCGTSNAKCTYTPTIYTGVTDRAGNALATDYSSTSFLATTDGTAPSVTSFVPPSGSSLAQNGNIAIFFSESMDRSTLTNTNLVLSGAAFQSVFPSEDGTWAVVNGYNNITSGSQSITVTRTAVRDRYVTTDGGNCENGGGNTIGGGSNPSATYTVVASNDTTPPTVSTVSPSDGSTSVSTSVAPSVTFSEAVDPRTIIPSSIFLMDAQGNIVDTSISFNSTGTTITLTPHSTLSNPGIYYVVATTAVRDLGGANAYDGDGGEAVSISGVLRTCFSTSATSCP